MDRSLDWDPSTGEVRAIVDELRALLDVMALRDAERLEREVERDREAPHPDAAPPGTT